MGVAGGVAAAAGTIAIAYLMLVAPLRGRNRFERLRAQVQQDRTALLHHYRRAVTRGWVSAAVALAIGGMAAIEGFHIGLGPPRDSGMARGYVVEILVIIPLSVVVFRLVPSLYRRMARPTLGGAALLLPVSRRERLWFVGVAFSAGIWEEVVFRGFVIGYLRWLIPRADDLLLVALSAALFGWAHLYQGRRGVVLTGLTGLLLGDLALMSGGLLAPMIVHVLIDLRFAVLPSLVAAQVQRATRDLALHHEPADLGAVTDAPGTVPPPAA